MHGVQVEIHNYEKLLENQRFMITILHCENMEYSRDQIFVWLDKYEENFKGNYFVKSLYKMDI